MKLRYEIKDRQAPLAQRGMRYSTLARARRELTHAYPLSRFYIWDRETKQEIT